MKLQTILHISYQMKNKRRNGFLTIEIMIAFSIFTLFTLSIYSLNTSMLEIKIWSLKELDILKSSTISMDYLIKNYNVGNTKNDNLFDLNQSIELYGNNSRILNSNLFSTTKSDYVESWGESSCSSRIIIDRNKIEYFTSSLSLGAGNISTDIEVRNSIAYLTSDSSNQSQADFFIINVHDYNNPTIISSLNTGPGLSALAVAGPYVYVANTSSISQLQIIDIHDRNFPHVISQLKLPLPEASTTPSKASSIYYKNGYVYIGTNKWDGQEFYCIDVSNPLIPKIVGSYETNTLVNDIFVNNNIAYLATSDESQMRMIDISDKTNLKLLCSFTSSGWQTQQGKVIEYFENTLGLGRTVGGVNKVSNHEIFIFSTSSNRILKSSQDIPGGIYVLMIRSPYIYLVTHAPLAEFQVWSNDLMTKIYQKSLGQNIVAMSCDWSTLYFATGDEKGISVLKLN